MSINTTENIANLVDEQQINQEATSVPKIILGSSTFAKLAGYTTDEAIATFKAKIGNPKGIVSYETIKPKLSQEEDSSILENYSVSDFPKRSIKSKSEHLREAANLLDEIEQLQNQLNNKKKEYNKIITFTKV